MHDSPQVLNIALNPIYTCPWTLHRTNIDDISFPCKSLRAQACGYFKSRCGRDGMEWSLSRDWGMEATATTTDSATNTDAGTTGGQIQTQTTTRRKLLPLLSMVG